MKYILVTGGVISGVGKGVLSSSLGALLRACGIRVTAIKIDPYINIDAGTFSPYEHGEVFVLDDGGEADLDLGNYERFMDVQLRSQNNITTGKMYQHVIEKERRGDYLGKTVQIVPHLTNAIQEWIERVARVPVVVDTHSSSKDNRLEPEVCIIELGGTVGDIEGMPFLEAFRRFHYQEKENFCVVHVSLVIEVGRDMEQKTKPTQNSVQELRRVGLVPDLVCCRSRLPVDAETRRKIAYFALVEAERVINVKDVPSMYHVPLLLQEQNVIQLIAERLKMDIPFVPSVLDRWQNLANSIEEVELRNKQVVIGMVGKYTKLIDAYTSVNKALEHSALHPACRRKLVIKYIDAADLEDDIKKTDPTAFHLAWAELNKCDGVLVPGGFGTRGIEGKINACRWSRENQKPFLGICLGYQCATIEFARNVLGIPDATSGEFDPTAKHPVVVEMPEHNPGNLGGTMRLGKRSTLFEKGSSVIKMLYGNVDKVEERHRHRYEVNPHYVGKLEEKGMCFVGRDEVGNRMEIMCLKDHPYFVGVQFHPEYLSRPLKPSPPYLGLLLAASGKLEALLKRSAANQQQILRGTLAMESPPFADLEECTNRKSPDIASKLHGGGDAGF